MIHYTTVNKILDLVRRLDKENINANELFAKLNNILLSDGWTQTKTNITDEINLQNFKEYVKKIIIDKEACKKFLIDTGINNEDGTLHKNFGG